jgi:hypothetical protein
MGDGYKVGQTVLVKIKMPKGIIEWYVNGIIQCELTNKKLRNKNLLYVPYIRLDCFDDSISIIK